MSYLPVGTPLGDLRITEVIEYYDRPLIFMCQDGLDRHYLACLADETGGVETWLYVGMSPRRWQHVRSRAIDLHDAFAKAEEGKVYRIRQDARTGDVIEPPETVPCANLLADDLPLPGEYAELPQESLSPHVPAPFSRNARP